MPMQFTHVWTGKGDGKSLNDPRNWDVGSVPGEGDGQILELLAELAAMNYDGCMTMEPHLQTGGQFGGSTGPELFSRAIAAVRRLADEVGLECD